MIEVCDLVTILIAFLDQLHYKVSHACVTVSVLYCVVAVCNYLILDKLSDP